MSMIKDLFGFIREREAIRIRKEAGWPKPWTTDPIFQHYRFCCVRREDDRVTRWIAENWRRPQAENPDLWFHMTVARLVNWPDTLAELQISGRWNPKAFVGVLHDRRERGEKVFSGAYIVATNGLAMDKAEYLANRILTPLWAARKQLRPQVADTLATVHTRLCTFTGMGSFMAAQVIADIKYAPPLSKAKDWWTFAASGPGSRRGLNRVLERPVDAPWREELWKAALGRLADDIAPLVRKARMEPLHNQDLQNCLCEADKMWRTQNGEGRPRATYPGMA
jgi:hypothetical protein